MTGWLLAAALLVPSVVRAQVAVDEFIKPDSFGDISISPDGTYYAATVPSQDRTGLVVLRRSDLKPTAQFAFGKNMHIDSFKWVSNERLIISMAQKFGALDRPQPTGELFGMNADGSEREILAGFRAEGPRLGSRIQAAKTQDVYAYLVDELAHDDKNVVVATWPFLSDPYTQAERMDVRNGRRILITRAPVRRADFQTDNAGVVRFAYGAGLDNNNQLYYRSGDGSEWQLINDEVGNGRREYPIGFSADDRLAYLLSERSKGPDALVALDVATQERRELLVDEVVDPHRVIYGLQDGLPVGALFMGETPKAAFFDEQSPDARLYRMLEQAFPGEALYVTSATRDGRLALVQTWSDRNPGDFFLFDTEQKKASHVLSRRDWFDPEAMAATRAVALEARDGLKLHGYLTAPAASAGRPMPLVVMPHGGPFGEKDSWGFDTEAQLLARAGYAVLQLNFRGSGGYGRSFQIAGARQWGKAMQDDLTDATLWLIREGIADKDRICIYGASYGAYAALMGVAKEPSLYQCAVGYIGVYDLPMMYTRGDVQQRVSGENWLREWVGPSTELAAVSPTNMAERIKVPVFLAAGGEDQRTPIAQSKLMERRLRAAGVPVETLYYDSEGHGFYTEPHRREYYTRLLDFLSRHIGGAKAN
jgi:dipeptidyl aminopeptidase/acylaminoacyl peptidase